MIVQECMTLNIAVIGVQRDWAALMAAFLASLLFFLISSFSFVQKDYFINYNTFCRMHTYQIANLLPFWWRLTISTFSFGQKYQFIYPFKTQFVWESQNNKKTEEIGTIEAKREKQKPLVLYHKYTEVITHLFTLQFLSLNFDQLSLPQKFFLQMHNIQITFCKCKKHTNALNIMPQLSFSKNQPEAIK